MEKYREHKFNKTKSFAFIGAPQCKAAGARNSGVVHTPTTLREIGIMDIIQTCDAEIEDFGDAFLRDDDGVYETPQYAYKVDEECQKSNNYRYVMNAAYLGKQGYMLYEKVKDAIEKKKVPLVFGGDNGVTTGTLAAVLTRFPDVVVFFIDAHTDINIPDTSIHGNYHGMVLAHLCGHMNVKNFEWMENLPKLNPKNIVYIGLRQLFQNDIDLIEKYGMTVFTMHDVASMGIGEVMRQALKAVDPDSNKPIHLSYDMDGSDPSIAPGSGAKMDGGLSYTESLYIPYFLNKTNRLVSFDMNEIHKDHDMDTPYSLVTRFPFKSKPTATIQLVTNITANLVMGRAINGKRVF